MSKLDDALGALVVASEYELPMSARKLANDAAAELAALRRIKIAAEALFQKCSELALTDDYYRINDEINALSIALREKGSVTHGNL